MGFLTPNIIETAVNNGLIYGCVALSLFISFTILNICDLSTDGCYILGAAVGVSVTIAGHPILAIFAGMAAGVCSGFVTAFLQTRLRVPDILAGIVVNTGLYTINLMVMGLRTNLNIVGTDTVFSMFESLNDSAFWQGWSDTILLLMIVAALCLFIYWFLTTRLGLSIRATGDSAPMVRASSINPAFTITVGLCLSNSFTGLAGCLIGQYTKTAEINQGTGMVTIALASLIIGQMIFGRGPMMVRIIGTVVGSVLYRFIIAIALRLNVPTQAFRLVSAVIVAIAIAAPAIRDFVRFSIRKRSVMCAHRAERKGGETHA
ncbi:MAG: hypothetical protein SOH60_00520 [Lachnospiraceae bacterium]|jgi:putative ABC transport system permease protein